MRNDIPHHINNCQILLYADDVKLFSVIKSVDEMTVIHFKEISIHYLFGVILMGSRLTFPNAV